VDSWVVAHLPHDVCIKISCRKHALTVMSTQDSGKTIYGRVTEILTISETDTSLAVVVLDVFDLKAARHPLFGMPVLARSSGQATYIIVSVTVGPFAKRLD